MDVTWKLEPPKSMALSTLAVTNHIHVHLSSKCK